ncbi:MAG: ABC transporter permease [Anaerolineae bacterium]|nr:ABC transporter permease [Anaerolineae bacterium]
MATNELAAVFKRETRAEQRLAAFQDIASVLAILGSALICWEIIVRVRHVPVYMMPAPTVIVLELFNKIVYYLRASFVTLAEALGGLLLGLLVGITTAIAITFWRQLERGMLMLAILIKTTPMVAITPLLIIWFGFGPLPKVIVTGLITFFPVLVNFHSGLHAVDAATLALFHSLNANRRELFRYARWPSALPYLFDALKVVAPLSLVGAVVAEWAGASVGLGRAMWLAYTNLNMPSLFAAVFCSALMGIGLYLVVIGLEKRVVYWK